MEDVALKRFQDKGIWIFVCLDLSIFFLFFLVFVLERHAAIEVFSKSQASLNETIGFINTLVLITSSWLFVMALRVLERNPLKAKNLLLLSIALGVLFSILKLYEYYEKFSAGISVVENTFYTFYFLLTFIHFCHVIGGLVALSMLFLWVSARYKTPDYCKDVGESIGIYWHMVDLLWVMLFMLLYLLR
ncbi:cytochrome c oxidase subunit 3 [Halioxenophilus aromaticivorans]|uniref:Cytochrome c oxidase subunit 3 n=1 Tax=Halioxenophilus aromaticivorans TaxID=1306992 RepID=A0AAV3TXT0_9ALTE